MADKNGIPTYNYLLKEKMNLLATYKGLNGNEYGIFSDMLKVLGSKLRTRIKNHYQNVIVITGETGSGKSTLALRLILELNPNWELQGNYIYDASDMARKLRHKETADKISLYDEGSVSFNSLNYSRRSDKQQIVILDTCRSLGWTTIICIASINDLNKRIREHLVDFLLVCPNRPLVKGYDKRGFFEVYRPRRDTWAKDTFYEPLGAGTYSRITGRLADEYEAIKFNHQMALLSDFTKEHGDEYDEEEE